MSDLVYLSTNMKDENNILEWVVYHLIIGFDKILIIDNESKIPISKIISDNHLSNKVDVIVYPGQAIKVPLMKNCVKPYMIKNKVKWFIHLDADEYLNLNNNYNNIKEFLNNFNQKDTNIIAINWVVFGTSLLDNTPIGLLIDNYTLCQNRNWKRYVKCFANPKEIKSCTSPHYWVMMPNTKGKTARNKKWPVSEGNTDFIGLDEPIYINHYIYQSIEDYCRRKVHRPSDFNGKFRGFPINDGLKTKLHSNHNDIPNEIIKTKYSSLIKKYMEELKTSPVDNFCV